MRTPFKPQGEHGAAMLTAMILVALVTTLTATMVWQQWRSIQVETAERARAQSYWILTGALDWARLILREDRKDDRNRPPKDHLGEPWAVPLAEARLSTFLAADSNNTADADAQGPDVFLSGSIQDLQSRFNLANVVDGVTGKVDPDQFLALETLCTFAKLPAGTAQMLADGWLNSFTPGSPRAASQVVAGLNDLSVAPKTLDELNRYGLDTNALEKLRPFLVVLPQATPINVNTASREVIAAALTQGDLGLAQRIVQQRQSQPWTSMAELAPALPGIPASSIAAKASVSTQFFEVSGRLRLDNQVVEERSYVQRTGAGNNIAVTPIYRERKTSVLGDLNR